MRILIADDNAGVREGIAALISSRPDWEVCGEAQDGPEAIEKTGALAPDVILLDISMPGMSGLDAARIIRKATGAKILVMSQHDPRVLAPRAKQVGAQGCLDKGNLSSELIPAIEALFRNPPPSETSETTEAS